MINLQSIAQYQLLNPGTISTSATSASNIIDRRSYNYANLVVAHQPATATNSSAQWASLKLQHSDSTAATSFVDVTGFTGTTNTTAAAGQFVLPVHNDTANTSRITFRIDLRPLRRYLRTVQQAGASHNTVCGEAVLGVAEIAPTSAANNSNLGSGTVVTG